ncbi:uncharacterized protein [Acropora muricata]|uniref:uncharacterized protein n=1 Tax=Acropora muricata TaxID=159855 RepID=UPI0034E4338F
MASETLSLKRVFSPHLNPEKHWYALNSRLCCSKPAAFCSTSSANLFPEEYKLVFLNDLRGEDGAQASFRWFCPFRSSEKVYVASAFGLSLGILRLKSWSNCLFMKSDYIHCLKSVLNTRGLECKVGDPSKTVASQQTQDEVVEALLTPQVKSTVESILGYQKVDLPTPPSTPSQSPPKFESPPNQSPGDVHRKGKKRTIEEIKVDQDLSPLSKRKKVREVATRIIKDIRKVCENNGETLGTVLAECSFMMRGKDGQDVRETVKSVIDVMVAEKGARKAFEKLVSKDSWNERVKCMRVPDWMYLLFKLKSRISDSGWQDLTNLTKLARTGKTSDEPILLIKNNITALRRAHFSVTRTLMNITALPKDVPGFEVNLENVAVWVIREMRLHGSLPDDITFNLKIDGRPFHVTLDYKGLVLLMAKIEDEDFLLGGRGLSVEFCIFCFALRACDCDLGRHEVCLEHFLQTKANIGGFKGLRDDLTCILDEELSSMSLCALHCEMRNTEQLLKSVGLLAYEIGSLDDCNQKLSEYGPANFKADRITVKLRPGQQVAAERNNISFASCSGIMPKRTGFREDIICCGNNIKFEFIDKSG